MRGKGITLQPGEYIARELVPLSPAGRRAYGAAMLMVTVVRKLGPANNGGEFADAVAIEIRAAELCAMTRDERDQQETMMEWAGRRHYVEGHETPTTFGGQAGWLAHAIANHPHNDRSGR
jgi:hypothetical protein